MSMVSLREVTKTYPGAKRAPAVTAVGGVSLEIEKGEFLVVTGRSGSGKTTLLNLAAGLIRPTSGQVMLDGIDLWKLSDAEQSRLRSRRIGFVFQFPSLLPSLTAFENVALPLSFSGDHAVEPERATELLGTVGLSDKLGSYPRQLSAGQQQRVVIARSLVNQPELLFADEPSSDLDEQTEREIMELFQRIHRETGVTIVMVTHTAQLVSYCTRAVEMATGALKPAGRPPVVRPSAAAD
jgi:ABC-type lipoprotein export system ATPase subunit